MALPENAPAPTNATLAELFRGAIASLWFAGNVKSYDSVRARHDLTPEGALCLLIMVTENVSTCSGIELHLHPFGGGSFDRTEAKILAESGLYSLQSNGYVRLDTKGKLEMQEHDHKFYGLGDIQWLLTAKAARALAPIYCTCKGLPSSEQTQAVKDMLAANKATVSANRKRKSSS